MLLLFSPVFALNPRRSVHTPRCPDISTKNASAKIRPKNHQKSGTLVEEFWVKGDPWKPSKLAKIAEKHGFSVIESCVFTWKLGFSDFWGLKNTPKAIRNTFGIIPFFPDCLKRPKTMIQKNLGLRNAYVRVKPWILPLTVAHCATPLRDLNLSTSCYLLVFCAEKAHSHRNSIMILWFMVKKRLNQGRDQ